MPQVHQTPQIRQITWTDAHGLGLMTIGQWEREGRKVKGKARKEPVAVVPWNGVDVRVFAQEQTYVYRPRPETLAFHRDCDQLLDFINPRRDAGQWGFKPRKQWDDPAWPLSSGYLDDDTWRRACRHQEGLACRPVPGGLYRWYAPDLDFHDRKDPKRFLARVDAAYDLVAEQGDDLFFACREEDISGLHVYGFGPEPLPLERIRSYANGLKAELIRRHPDLFDEGLEVYPDPRQSFRLPLFPGRCVILDRPLAGLPAKEQLHELVGWFEKPGRPMPKGELLEWIKERLPQPPKIVVAVPQAAREPEAKIDEHADDDILAEFLASLGTPKPRNPAERDFFAERNRAAFAGVEADWDRLLKAEGWASANAFLDGVAPPLDKFKSDRDKAFSLGGAWSPLLDRWERSYREGGWEAARAFLHAAAGPAMKAKATEAAVVHEKESVVVVELEKEKAIEAAVAHEKESAVAVVPARPKVRETTVVEEKFPVVVEQEKPPVVGHVHKMTGRPTYRGCTFEVIDGFLTGRIRPADATLDAYLGPLVRFQLQDGHSAEAILDFIRRFVLTLPDVSFSGRLSQDPERLLKSYGRSLGKIGDSNGYQPDPERSSSILANLVAAMRSQGLSTLDPTAFGRYRRVRSFAVAEHKLGFHDRLKAKEALTWLDEDVKVVYAVASRLVGWAEANPGRQMAGKLVPCLCSDLGIDWHCGSDFRCDGTARRCKKAERVIAALVRSGLLTRTKEARFFGYHNPDNKAAEYAPGPELQAARAAALHGEGGGEASTIEESSFTVDARFAALLPKVRRLRRRLRWLRGPPSMAA